MGEGSVTCRASAPGWQRDAPQLAQEKGTHSSIPLLFQVYFVVPLTVFPKHLIPPHCIPRFFFCISLLPLGLWDVFKDTKIGKYRQTPTWYKFSNMSWRISFFFFPCRLFQHRKPLVQTAHPAACGSAQRPSTDCSSSSSCEEADL